VIAVNTGNFYLDRLPTVAQADSVSLPAILGFYRKRFANAADFTFFFGGSFSADSVAPLMARYLGSLPSTGKRTSAYIPRGPRFPTAVRTGQVRKGVEPKSSTRITFFTHEPIDELDMHRARAAGSILTDHLRQVLREMLGATYSASAAFDYRHPVSGYTTMSISFGSGPENVDKMVAAALEEVKKLRDNGPSAEDLQKDQEIERRELETADKQNGYWVGSLQTSHQLGWDPKRILKRRERIGLLTVENLRETYRKYFPPDRYTVLTLLPEAGSGTRTSRSKVGK
jgi:zinc protease